MDYKKLILGTLVIVSMACLIGMNTVSAKKTSKLKMPVETINEMATQVDTLTKKVYSRTLLSPEDNANLIDVKIKLDNQMLLEPDTTLAPLYYKVGCMYKMRDMTSEAIECFQTILENFSDTALAPKAMQSLKDMGVDVSKFEEANKPVENSDSSEDEENYEEEY